MLENYSRVRLLTDKFQPEGASRGDLGYIIETYPDGAYEVEFSDPSGITFAQIVAAEDDLQQDEPTLQRQRVMPGDTVVKTEYFDPVASKTAKSEIS